MALFINKTKLFNATICHCVETKQSVLTQQFGTVCKQNKEI